MKMIILAAGTGQRLMPLTRHTPKPLLDLGNGRTLLEEQLQRMQASGVIDEIIIVIGYLAEAIEAKVQALANEGVRIRTIYNPFYRSSNNFISLWLAMPEMTDHFMITNGDNLFAPEIFTQLVRENEQGIVVSVQRKAHYDDDDMKATVVADCVTHVSKLIPAHEAAAESPGLALVHGPRARAQFCQSLDRLVRHDSSQGIYWLEVFNDLSRHDVPVRAWWFQEDWKWQEVDFHLDIEKARELLRIR